MQAKISNFRGLASADLDISKICLVAAPNEGGKTSTIQAVAAALTGDPLPIAGVKKAMAGMLVRSGTAAGSIDLESATGKTNIHWPSAKVKSEGSPPYASHFAAGIYSLATLDEKERPKILADYLKASPTRADLDAQLADMKLLPKVMDQLWELIEKQGWDNAHAQIKEKGARLKGQWQQITGEQHGSKKAENFIPAGYEQDLMGQSEETLSAQVTDARDALEATIATDAVDDSRRGDLEARVALKQERQQAVDDTQAAPVDGALAAQIEEAQAFVKDISAKRDVIQAELRELPSARQVTGMPCPHCDTVLQVSGGNLTIAAVLSEDEITTRQAAIDALQGKLDATNDAIAKHMTSISGIQSCIREAEKAHDTAITDALRVLGDSTLAEQELAGMAAPVVGKQGGAPSYVEQCRTTLNRADTRLKAFVQKRDADILHATIMSNAELVARVAADGIRADVLAKAIKGFNDKMLPLCKVAGWRPVALETDFSPTQGGTPYMLLSESAKFRVRVVLQLAMAQMDNSQAVVIDAADILDKDGRNGLFKAIHSTGMPALVAMTIDKKDLVPNVGKAGIGASYWIGADAVAELI